MTWFDLVKSEEFKEFEILANKYAHGDMIHLDYLRKKHGKRSSEFYNALEEQVMGFLKQEEGWVTIHDIVKSLKETNEGLKDKDENLESFLRNRLVKMDITTKQERSVGRTGMKTYYKVK
tara:strand:- start:56 stop:415 length:360 start_codon:yes stop_codon:yes gene_type:complete